MYVHNTEVTDLRSWVLLPSMNTLWLTDDCPILYSKICKDCRLPFQKKYETCYRCNNDNIDIIEFKYI